MALAKLAHKCRACPKVLTCDHKEMEMHGFLPIPEGGFNNPDVDIVAGVDVANGPDLTSNIIVHLTEKSIELGRPYPTSPDELKKALIRIIEGRRYGVFG